MPTLVTGDIHGCYLELLALLEKSGLGEADSIAAVGDIVDRGPETPRVLLLLAYETLVVLGLIAVVRGLAFLAAMALFVSPVRSSLACGAGV